MVSMKDLAAACNVSVATVSKALNDQHDVSAKTKEMVRKKAKELGYFPNSAAKALKTNRSHNIGVLFVDEAQSGLTHDFFANVLDSFKRTIELKDYDLTLVNCSKVHNGSMTYLERARYRGFDGVAIACIDFRDPEVIDLVDSNIPVVTIDYIFNNRIAVISDNVKGMRDLVTYVYEMGHRKIAFVGGDRSARFSVIRENAYYEEGERLGCVRDSTYVMLTGMRPSAVRAAMMLAIYMLAPSFGCRPNARAAWSVTALAVYGLYPERLFDLPADASVYICMLEYIAYTFQHGNNRLFIPYCH